ncbi:hypothetical protein NDU88_006185 [Pleurodeles waltl]|uniref:Uncharacterized protein n=1 Tax=Pleurodeles waltl TaxID=8319 RepID=A0AAV7UKA3_PLEWA|nr:hypothetical protein NDU88_006185 [Pleurodeles waltl]
MKWGVDVALSVCDGPLLHQAGPSCPEELAAMSNPFSLPGGEGQEQVMRPFRRRKSEHTEWNGGGGVESGKEKEMRGVTGGQQGVEGFVATGCHSEDLSEESEVQEEPSASSGHA